LTVKNSQGQTIVMGRSMAVVIVDQSGKELSTQKVVYGARLLVDEGQEVTRGARLAQWDPYTRPILTEVDGFADFEDLVDGASVLESTDEVKGTVSRVVIDWRATPRGAELKPALVVQDDKGNPIEIERGGDARYLLPVDAILSVGRGDKVAAGDVLARIPREGPPRPERHHRGSAPRVAELFEARRPKDHAIIAEIDGTVSSSSKDYKNKQPHLHSSRMTRPRRIPPNT
jgi:DNA-directed RNA polymerase subunit beta'